MDNFREGINIYRARYRLEVSAFLKFLHEKIHADEEGLQLIESRILEQKQRHDKITVEQLEQYFHLIAAYQAKVNIKGKELASLNTFTNLKFKSSKNKQTQKKKEITKVEQKQEKQENKEVAANLYPQLSERQVKVQSTMKKQEKEEKVKVVDISKQEARGSLKKEAKKLDIIEENIVGQDLMATAMGLSPTEELMLNIPEAKTMEPVSKKSVFISGYDKFGQNYLTPIIKYHLIYGQYEVYRRYSQFQNLMNYLNRQYLGIILPQLPPKEGIRSNFTYFWGVDEVFLNERQQKLQNMLNQLLNISIIKDDLYLLQFLKDQNFELQAGEGVFSSYLQTMSNITFSTTELKTYGIAYINYFKEFNKESIETAVMTKYKELQGLLHQCMAIDSYRTTINANFEQRREIFKELHFDKDDRNVTVTDFDKMSAATASKIHNLNKVINKYLDLQSDLNWLNHLIKEKQKESSSDLVQLQKRLEKTENLIFKMEEHLMRQMQELKKEKEIYLKEVAAKMIEWRKRIHP